MDEKTTRILNQIPSEKFTIKDTTYLESCPLCGGRGFEVKAGKYVCKSCGKKGTLKQLCEELHIQHPDDKADPDKMRPEQVFIWSQQEQDAELISAMDKLGITEETLKKYNVKHRELADKTHEAIFFHTLPSDTDKVSNFSVYHSLIAEKPLDDAIVDGCTWSKQDVKEHAFGWREIDFSKDYIYITSDPIDCLALTQAGLKNVISAPGSYEATGDDSWISNDKLFISKFDQIRTICKRGRLTGEMQLKNELQRRFPGRVYALPGYLYDSKENARDLVQLYGENFMKIEKNLINVGSDALIPAAEVEWKDPEKIERVKCSIDDIDGILGGGFELGRTVVLTGEAGAGKSTFLSQLIINFIYRNQKVFIYSGELEPWQTKQWLAQQLAGKEGTTPRKLPGGYTTYDVLPSMRPKIDKFIRDRLYIYGQSAFISSNEESEENFILKQTVEAIERHGCKIIMIDNVLSAVDESAGENEYARQSEFMRKLVRIAKSKGVLIFLVAHPKKVQAGTEFSLDSIYGSGSFTKLADVVCCYARGTGLQETERFLHILKNRIAGYLTSKDRRIVLTFDPQTRRIFSGKNKIADYLKNV